MKQQIFYGNEEAVNLLLRENSRSLPHAVLLYGEKGLGKKRLARLLACRYLVLPEEYQYGAEFFSTPSAKLVFSNIHPDVVVLGEDIPTIKVGEIRTLGETVYLAPNQSLGRMYIIEGADRMNAQAQNALLKLLEDPPGQVRFILTASSKYRFLETILSRVWSVELRRLEEEALEDFLLASLPADGDQDVLQNATNHFPGNGGAILEAVQNSLSDVQCTTDQIIDAMIEQSVYQIAVILEKIKKDRAFLFEVFMNVKREVESALLLENPYASEKAKCMNRTMSSKNLYDALQFLTKIEQRWIFNPSLSIVNMEAASVLGGAFGETQ